MNQKNGGIWSFPWGFPEGFSIVTALILIGFGIDFATNTRAVIPSFPANLYLITAFIAVLIPVQIFFKKHPILIWMSGIKAALAASAGITVLVFLMGMILQDDQAASPFLKRSGLSHITESRAFLYMMIFFLAVLGSTIIKRISTYRLKDTAFLLNHIGLWLVIAAGGLGSGDLIRLKMLVAEDGKPVFTASDDEKKYNLPFALQLNDFVLKQYPPKLAFVKTKTGRIDKNAPMLPLKKGSKLEYLSYKIEVAEYLEDAAPFNNNQKFVKYRDKGSAPAAMLKIKNKTDSLKAWVSSGSYMFSSVFVPLNSEYKLVMTEPEPKLYQSELNIYTKSGEKDSAVINVNKPYKIDGWKIYQLNYDRQKGKWSEISILEIVKDPWLPVVYAGFFMMITGVVTLIGKKKKTKDRNNNG